MGVPGKGGIYHDIIDIIISPPFPGCLWISESVKVETDSRTPKKPRLENKPTADF